MACSIHIKAPERAKPASGSASADDKDGDKKDGGDNESRSTAGSAKASPAGSPQGSRRGSSAGTDAAGEDKPKEDASAESKPADDSKDKAKESKKEESEEKEKPAAAEVPKAPITLVAVGKWDEEVKLFECAVLLYRIGSLICRRACWLIRRTPRRRLRLASLWTPPAASSLCRSDNPSLRMKLTPTSLNC